MNNSIICKYNVMVKKNEFEWYKSNYKVIYKFVILKHKTKMLHSLDIYVNVQR